MLYFSRWKILGISFILFFGIVFSLPNILSDSYSRLLPNFIQDNRLALGLDLQGGVHLQLKIEEEGLIDERLETLSSDVRSRLLDPDEGRIGYTDLSIRNGEVRVRLRNADDMDTALDRLDVLTEPVASSSGLIGSLGIVEVSIDNSDSTNISLALTDDGINNRLRSAVQQSIEVIRRRVDELGTTEPVIQRQGSDRIIVQVPGFNDPETLKRTIGKTAKLSFHEVNDSVNARDVSDRGTRAPVGYELLYTNDPNPLPVLVKKAVKIKGDDLEDAQPGFDQRTGEPIVNFKFNLKAARIFGEYTSQNTGKQFAIVLDDLVISAPRINDAILGGAGYISGSFTPETANELAVLMRAGALPAKLTFVEERTVGPGLGQDSIDSGQSAAIIAGILVVIFMLLTYGLLGGFATFALTFNMFLIISILSVLGATLTLPGIAGIVLTMGMAVDANVLIYERIREERRKGRSLIQSVESGFKQALTTILDANITTLIAACILFYLGSGPIRGFAVTLAIGIITSVFTAFTLTRLFMSLWLRRSRSDELPRFFISLVPSVTRLKFLVYRRFSFPLSLLLLFGSIGLFSYQNLNYGIDFRGGTLIEYQSNTEVADISDIRFRLSSLDLGDFQVQEFGTPRDILIRLESQGDDSAEQVILSRVRELMDSDYTFRRQEVVGPTVSGELALAGTIAVLVSLLAIMIYIWFRFEWQFALGAVFATAHDVLLTLGIFSLLQLEFSLSSIAAILTIVGYSLNDTVVVYDRIRENLRKYKKQDLGSVLDLSINDTLSRTVMTSATTLLALLSLYFLGGEVLRNFTFAMIFGVIVGTYSSVFIASPLLIFLGLRPGAMSPVDVSPYSGQEAQGGN